MNELKRFWVVLPAVVLLALAVGWYRTRGVMELLSSEMDKAAQRQNVVDETAWQRASTLAPLAVSAEEQQLAQEAERLAGREVEDALKAELARENAQSKPSTGKAAKLENEVSELKTKVGQDTKDVENATKESAANGLPRMDGDKLELAEAQLELDRDELVDASVDLSRMTHDQRGQINHELEAHQTEMKRLVPVNGETAATTERRFGTLSGQVMAWLRQEERVKLIDKAKEGAQEDVAKLPKQHDQLERFSETAPESGEMPTTDGAGRAKVKALKRQAAQRNRMNLLDEQTDTAQQLVTVYERWKAQVAIQHKMLIHLMLQSLGLIAGIVLAAGVGLRVAKAALGRLSGDVRRASTLEKIVTLAIQVVGALLILLVVFGPPEQTPTILGLATAGLTVVFQDYILSFVGWFKLMGKDGVRVGDWVEINSIGGQVSEIGLFRTVLLETGNWTSQGHPTGRRITFSNSFAIRGQFFNFSTHGQWMWDEIKVNVPAGLDADAVIARLQTAIQEEAARDMGRADAEWRGVAGTKALGQFSAAPTMDLRPAAAGVDVIVRFMTRADERFEQRNRLFEAVRRILAETGAATGAEAAAAKG